MIALTLDSHTPTDASADDYIAAARIAINSADYGSAVEQLSAALALDPLRPQSIALFDTLLRKAGRPLQLVRLPEGDTFFRLRIETEASVAKTPLVEFQPNDILFHDAHAELRPLLQFVAELSEHPRRMVHRDDSMSSRRERQADPKHNNRMLSRSSKHRDGRLNAHAATGA